MGQWPKLEYEKYQECLETTHLYLQVLGKIALANSTWVNHSWHTTFEVVPNGFRTQAFSCGDKSALIEVNFLRSTFKFERSDGVSLEMPLQQETVASFSEKAVKAAKYLGLSVEFSPYPSEIEGAIPFEQDFKHRRYDPSSVLAFSRALSSIDQIFKDFRSKFTAKTSPVHFFWGGFDLAVTVFTGRNAPEHPGGFPHLPDRVAREAYSHELASFGFFFGNSACPYPAFYSYVYPEPAGYKEAKLEPKEAFYHKELHEHILPYEEVVKKPHPEKAIRRFLETAYLSAVELAHWDRSRLEEGPYLRLCKERNEWKDIKESHPPLH